MKLPLIGDIVHFVDQRKPMPSTTGMGSASKAPQNVCAPAMVTQAHDNGMLSLTVSRPAQRPELEHGVSWDERDTKANMKPGSWHWSEECPCKA